jgi:RNA polymerase sigma-70 factor (ECF subfamily)
MSKDHKYPLQTKAGPLNDEQLAARAALGEEAALSQLVERYHGPLLGYLYRLVYGDRALAEDLVQETFVRVLRQNSYQASRPFKPWLYAIATNLARDYFRSPKSRENQSLEEDVQLELRDTSPGPEEIIQAADKGREVMLSLKRLGPGYRAVLLLRYYQSLSLQEIAETLGLPLGTVKSRLSVGTHRLRDLLVAMKEEV